MMGDIIHSWMRTAALKETTGAMPICAKLQDYLQDTLRLLTPPATEAGGRK